MMEIKIASRTQIDEAEHPRLFHYYLVVEPVETTGFSFENYGVRVSEADGEDSYIAGITTSATRIDELMTLLVDHTVGPTALRDVVGDWL